MRASLVILLLALPAIAVAAKNNPSVAASDSVTLLIANYQSHIDQFETLVADFRRLGIDQVSTGPGTSAHSEQQTLQVQTIKEELKTLNALLIDESIFSDGSDGAAIAILTASQCVSGSGTDDCVNSHFMYVNAAEMLDEKCPDDFSYLKARDGACMREIGDHWYLWHLWVHDR